MGRNINFGKIYDDHREQFRLDALEARAIPKLLNEAIFPAVMLLRMASREWCLVDQALVDVRKAIDRKELAPQTLIAALIVAEDHRFVSHEGIDVFAIGRAFLCCLMGKLQGASTIEQQLARTLTGDRSRTISRKFKDWIIAAHISSSFTKDEIATAYLETAYFGYADTGYRYAANALGYVADQLSLSDCCAIAALLKRPMGRSPTARMFQMHRARHKRIEARLMLAVSLNPRKAG